MAYWTGCGVSLQGNTVFRLERDSSSCLLCPIHCETHTQETPRSTATTSTLHSLLLPHTIVEPHKHSPRCRTRRKPRHHELAHAMRAKSKPHHRWRAKVNGSGEEMLVWNQEKGTRSRRGGSNSLLRLS
jgi:hypothetical protein